MQVVPIHAFRKCSICGLPSDATHETPRHCLRAIDAEVRQLVRRTHLLTGKRGQILAQWLNATKVSVVTINSSSEESARESKRRKVAGGAGDLESS